MRVFSYLYLKTIKWSTHRHAPIYLAGVSFAESSFFPVPPDAMLITMGLANTNKTWYYALIASVFSVLGGIFGYLIGLYFIEFIQPWLVNSSYVCYYQQVVNYFTRYGVWVIFFAGFAPVPPYKIFTITAGSLMMAFIPFVVASILGRGLRFFAVATMVFWLGDRIHTNLKRHIDKLGWTISVLTVVAFFILQYLL